MARYIRSMYWTNIDAAIPALQKQVFQHLGFEIVQDEVTGVQHGDWMDKVLSELGEDDSVLFVDIDCIPLSRTPVVAAFKSAEAGQIYGSAQTANHMPDSQLIYAAPSFLGLAGSDMVCTRSGQHEAFRRA